MPQWGPKGSGMPQWGIPDLFFLLCSLSMFTHIFLPSSIYLSDFILAVLKRDCLENTRACVPDFLQPSEGCLLFPGTAASSEKDNQCEMVILKNTQVTLNKLNKKNAILLKQAAHPLTQQLTNFTTSYLVVSGSSSHNRPEQAL